MNSNKPNNRFQLYSLQLLPASWVRSALFLELFVFLCPIGTVLYHAWKGSLTSPNLAPLLLCLCALLVLYSGLLGIVFLTFRIPYLQDWKDKLGYKES